MFTKNPRGHYETRKCLNCGKEWSIYVLDNRKTSKRTHFCQDCVRELSTWERKKILEEVFPERRDIYLQQKRDEFLRRYIKTKLEHCKIRALKKGIEFNLTEEDIVIPELCPILEVPLVIGTKGDYEYSPSIDRIDNTKGYIKGNVQIISKKANSMKNCASYKELQAFCKNVLRYSLNNREEESIESEDKEPQS